jgi:hypothetical protein
MSDERSKTPEPERIEAVFRNGSVTVVGVAIAIVVDVIAVVEGRS